MQPSATLDTGLEPFAHNAPVFSVLEGELRSRAATELRSVPRHHLVAAAPPRLEMKWNVKLVSFAVSFGYALKIDSLKLYNEVDVDTGPAM